MNETYYLGIDPGTKGAWVLQDEGGSIVGHGELPYTGNRLNERGLTALIEYAMGGPWPTWPANILVHAAIEHPIARSGESDFGHLMSGVNFGKMLSIISLVFQARPDNVRTPAPHVWKQNMRLTNEKDLSVRRAELLWPANAAIFRGPRGGLRDGIAEAALLSEWVRRKHLKLSTMEDGTVAPVTSETVRLAAARLQELNSEAGSFDKVVNDDWGILQAEKAAAFRERHDW